MQLYFNCHLGCELLAVALVMLINLLLSKSKRVKINDMYGYRKNGDNLVAISFKGICFRFFI